MNVAEFKATYQIASLFKRYRFEKDLYSDAELERKAINGFNQTQSRLAKLDITKHDASTSLVLDLAANYIAKVLGKYDDEEHRSLCRFGRRASVGVPARQACEAARWELPISGSYEQISWFLREIEDDTAVQTYFGKQMAERSYSGPLFQEVSSLKLALVPKTFKSLRSIMPNTTIGSYMSDGLGRMIRKRLKRKGYDISKLQVEHRSLARLASISGINATADLSSASDSISDVLVQRLFPADWYEVLRQSRIGFVRLPDGSRVRSLTHCTMGIGYTFPLQTLIFLALLVAIRTLYFGRADRSYISVYGDDLIFPSAMYNLVAFHFEQLGFIVNIDKTYYEGKFRESCGGDYYHGVDVRPFQPQNGQAKVGKRTYEAILYKYVNCLLARWSEYEVGSTLDYLTSEIAFVTGRCKLVPMHHPDDSGIKCPSLAFWDFLKRAKCAHPKHIGHGVYRFSFLRLTPDEREEKRHEPYLWRALRGPAAEADAYCGETFVQELRTPLQLLIEGLYGDVEERECFARNIPNPAGEGCKITFTKSALSKEKNRRLSQEVTCMAVSLSGRYTRQYGTSCFEFRR
jgi:hypothetical protein